MDLHLERGLRKGETDLRSGRRQCAAPGSARHSCRKLGEHELARQLAQEALSKRHDRAELGMALVMNACGDKEARNPVV